MSYALIKNIPLNAGLFTKDSGKQIEWRKYGLGFHSHLGTVVGRHAPSDEHPNGLFHNVIFIEDLETFEKRLPELEAYCKSTPNPDDSVEIIDDIDADECIRYILDERERVANE